MLRYVVCVFVVGFCFFLFLIALTLSLCFCFACCCACCFVFVVLVLVFFSCAFLLLFCVCFVGLLSVLFADASRDVFFCVLSLSACFFVVCDVASFVFAFCSA